MENRSAAGEKTAGSASTRNGNVAELSSAGSRAGDQAGAESQTTAAGRREGQVARRAAKGEGARVAEQVHDDALEGL